MVDYNVYSICCRCTSACLFWGVARLVRALRLAFHVPFLAVLVANLNSDVCRSGLHPGRACSSHARTLRARLNGVRGSSHESQASELSRGHRCSLPGSGSLLAIGSRASWPGRDECPAMMGNVREVYLVSEYDGRLCQWDAIVWVLEENEKRMFSMYGTSPRLI
ncbi:hypothetical protein BKA93DRAFT_140234 [Sparassis latifolia]